MKAGARYRGLVATVLGAGWLGCALPVVAPGEMPAAPIAILYRTLEQGRERADELERARGEQPNAALAGEGIMTRGAADQFMDRLRGQRNVRNDLQGQIALLDPRTGRVEPLRAFVAGAIPAAWSPERDQLLAVSPHRRTAQLYEYSLERRELARVLRGHEPRIGGCYGPDGRLAYVQLRKRSGSFDTRIWLTGPQRRGARVQTDGPRDQGLACSRDGRFLLYESYSSGASPVIMAIDLRDEVPEPKRIARGLEPAISPLGDWVVYVRETREGMRLWRMRPDGTGKSALGTRSQGEAEERHPTISPDGGFVAYVAEEDDRQRIRVRRMDGTGDRLLLEDGDGTLPVW